MMKKTSLISIVLLSITTQTIYSQKIATIKVELRQQTNGLSVPVNINLDDVTFLSDSLLSLQETNGNKTTTVPFQITQGDNRKMHWTITHNNLSGKIRTYQLVKSPAEKFSTISNASNKGRLTFQSGNQPLLSYQFQTVYPPEGQDTNYKRSGFIHPLWTPHGQELTRIQPEDHYHHYGIWNPWTHTVFENDTVDFWNIKGRQGTVRFAKFISQTNGPVFSEFEALHEHVVFKKDGTEKVALNELQTVRVYKPEINSDYYLVDITSKLNCATESPFLIVAYRYAGLGWRTTGYWNNENCEVLTSEGKTRKDTDGSKAKWIIVRGALPGNDTGGAAILSYPANYNHPEPLRIWVLNTNGRGDMFANFAPTKDRNWLLEPGKSYTLRYRLIVFNGKLNREKAESAWQYFAAPPELAISKKR